MIKYTFNETNRIQNSREIQKIANRRPYFTENTSNLRVIVEKLKITEFLKRMK